MPIQFDRAVFATGGSLRVNLPAPIAEALSIKEGDHVTISLNDHQIIIEKAKKERK